VIKKFVFIILVLGAMVYLAGCAKKQEALEEMQAPMSMEALSALNTTLQPAPESKVTESKTQGISQSISATPAELKPLPPTGPYKPTAIEIQTALKNAGYYTAVIDGRIGPLTKKAIEEFQKANGLKADGKVGLQTWGVLSKYLNPVPVAPAKTPAKKR